MKKQQIAVQGISITVLEGDFISLTDLAKKFNEQDPNDLVRNWMRLKDTIELLGAWEMLHNEHFKPVEFDGFKNQAGSNRFTMSPSKWVEATNAIAALYNMNHLSLERLLSPILPNENNPSENP